MIRTEPIVFSPVDQQDTLFFAGNTLWKTLDGGNNWEQISPDLTRKTWEVPASVGKFNIGRPKPAQRASSTQSPRRSRTSTASGRDRRRSDPPDDGRRQNWTDITPKSVTAWQKISILDAGHFDEDTAYAAVNTLRLDDNRPHIYRTHDGGQTWTEIVRGIPDGQTVNVVREDPVRKGLLFAGTSAPFTFRLTTAKIGSR